MTPTRPEGKGPGCCAYRVVSMMGSSYLLSERQTYRRVQYNTGENAIGSKLVYSGRISQSGARLDLSRAVQWGRDVLGWSALVLLVAARAACWLLIVPLPRQRGHTKGVLLISILGATKPEVLVRINRSAPVAVGAACQVRHLQNPRAIVSSAPSAVITRPSASSGTSKMMGPSRLMPGSIGYCGNWCSFASIHRSSFQI